jgi:ethanolaminephosphotransferase
MPRIKAIISGTLPSFMDYILNLSAYKFNGENLVENAFKANKKIVFYGDDTWTHVLPQQVFYRSNGTSSFFATDYIEVDTNVTFNINKELNQLNDWDIMIAHYLGVDHIGHSHGGHNSNLMPKKLLEMDNVIKNIYETVSKNAKSEPYLIVITGDHGMTDVGNHGGNTLEETETALIFLSTHKTKINRFDERRAERVLQIDIASTLSSLMGLPLPNKSRGKIILSVLDAFYMEKDQQMCQLFSNALQIDSLISPELSSKHKKVIQQAFKAHISLIEDNSPKAKTNFNFWSTIC